jgi:hypothetical protein
MGHSDQGGPYRRAIGARRIRALFCEVRLQKAHIVLQGSVARTGHRSVTRTRVKRLESAKAEKIHT